MAVKSKTKPKLKSKTKVKAKAKAKPKLKLKTKVKARAKVRSKVAVKAKPARKLTSKPKVKAKILKKPNAKLDVKASSKNTLEARAHAQSIVEKMPEKISARKAAKTVITVVKRVGSPLVERRKPIKRSLRVNQFAFMRAPGLDHAFEVGGTVEVFCDHEKSRERIRGWLKGIVVQVDNKMVAVQFRSNVYLTEGWMVPDRILWYPLGSEHIRAVPGKKPVVKKEFIPEY